MMLANPMILAIVAVVAALAFAGYMIYKHWDKIKAAFAVAWTWMQQAWGNIVSVFQRGVALAMQVFFNFTPLGIIIKNIMPALAWLKKIDMLAIGKNLIDGLINGITAKVNALKATIKGIANSTVTWFKGLLGIHSPSRVFMGFGDNIGDGLAIGMQRSIKGPMKQARNMAAGVAGAALLAAPVMAETPSRIASAIQPSQVAVSSATARAPLVMQFGDIVIHIHTTADQSPQDIAEAVAREIDKLKREGEKQARDAFRDDEA
jgi:phage-related protein